MIIWKRCNIEFKLLLFTDSKSHISLRVAPK